MVARINTSKSISKALNYNEAKLKAGTAELLLASGFIKNTEKLNFYDKIRQFERYISLNEKATTNTLHISLNFDRSDHLSKEKLTAIAEHYMEAIGFGHQPFLVYQHFDSGHPHIHIVSTNIQKDGCRISVHNLGRNQSEVARKEIEIKFGLIKAEKKGLAESFKIQPVNVQKVLYGKNTTKQAIANVLNEVIRNYKFSSLPEFNAILKLFNVTADRGLEDSKMYKGKGLVYRVLDEKGIPFGAPIKASAFYQKSTLAFLEEKFLENDSLKQPFGKRIKVEIEFALAKSRYPSLNNFIQELEKGQISPVLRKTKDGLIYGITYVDHKTKTVFNGSDLGKEYSAKAILERCGLKESISLPQISKALIKPRQITVQEDYDSQPKNNLMDILMQPELNAGGIPYPFKKDAKKKKRKRISL